MSEQPGTPDSQPSMESRIDSMLFGEEPSVPAEMHETADPVMDADDAAEPESDVQPEAQTDAAPQEGTSELEEINYLGKQYKVPKELAEDFRQRDAYTKRTQEVAERARMIEAYEQQLQVRQAFEQATTDKREQLSQLQSQLAQFKQVDWSQLDTDSIVRLKTQQDTIRDKIGELNTQLNGDWQRVQGEQESAKRQLLQAASDYLTKSIPDWGPARIQAIRKQAIAEGFTAEQVEAMSQNPNPLTPMLFKLLDKAERLSSIEQRSQSALTKAKAAPPVAKPGASDPQLSERMKTLNFRKQVSTAKTPAQKHALILQRLEKKFG
jgi:hypothetical protein